MEEVTGHAAAQAARARVTLARRLVLAGAQFLADPEHQEQPVVGTRPQHQHDHQELGQGGHLQAVRRGLGDQRPGDRHREQRRDQRGQRQRQRPEDEDQQDDDEQQRQFLDLGAGRAGRLLLVHGRGDVTGQVHLQAGGQPGARDLASKRVHQVQRGVRVPPVQLGCQHHELLRVPVRRDPGVQDLGDTGYRLQPDLERRHGRLVGWSKRRTGARRHDRDRLQARGAERLGQDRRSLAGRAGRQELGVVGLRHVGERRQLRGRCDRADDPHEDDQPAEPDGEAPDGAEGRVDTHSEKAYGRPAGSRGR